MKGNNRNLKNVDYFKIHYSKPVHIIFYKVKNKLSYNEWNIEKLKLLNLLIIIMQENYLVVVFDGF